MHELVEHLAAASLLILAAVVFAVMLWAGSRVH
jgi:hypothetical protein